MFSFKRTRVVSAAILALSVSVAAKAAPVDYNGISVSTTITNVTTGTVIVGELPYDAVATLNNGVLEVSGTVGQSVPIPSGIEGTLLFQDAMFTGTSSTDGAFTLTGGSMNWNCDGSTSSLCNLYAQQGLLSTTQNPVPLALSSASGSISANGGNLTSSLTEVVAGDTYTYAYNYVVPAAAVPAPPAVWLLCSGLLFLLGVAQTRRV